MEQANRNYFSWGVPGPQHALQHAPREARYPDFGRVPDMIYEGDGKFRCTHQGKMHGPQNAIVPMARHTEFPSCCGARIIHGLQRQYELPPPDNGGDNPFGYPRTDFAITAYDDPSDSYMLKRGFELLKTFRSAHGTHPCKLWCRVSEKQKWPIPDTTITVPPLPAKGD